MEGWQKLHIKKKLPYLIETTICSVRLKAGLLAKDLLSDEEDERLTALGRQYGETSEARELYKIIVTKPMGYEGLMEELKETRQRGALQILEDGLQEETSRETLTVRKDSLEQLMTLSFEICGSTKTFHEMFSNFTNEDAIELIRNNDVKQELEQMSLHKTMSIKLDMELPVPQNLYISRLLSNRLHLNSKIFALNQNTCNDVFVFKDIPRWDLVNLVRPNSIQSSTNQRSLITSRHIFLDHDEDWDDLMTVSESPIHLVGREENSYLLLRTTKVTDIIQNYASREGRNNEAFVTEDKFVEQFVASNDSKGALICDIPGMGKTWLMKSLAVKIRQSRELLIVYFIELASLSEILYELMPQPVATQVLKILLDYACPSKLMSHLVQKLAGQNTLDIVFVLDGYDEIRSAAIPITESSLKALLQNDHVRVIVSSRPNMRVSLQKLLNLISYDIMPFGREEQVRCMVEQWSKLCPETNSADKLKQFAIQCIKSVKSIKSNKTYEILGVPLKCYLLATVNEKQAKMLCKPNRQRQFQITEAATVKSVFELCTKFVDTLVDKVTLTMPDNARGDFAKRVIIFLTHKALELLTPHVTYLHSYLSSHTVDNSIESVVSTLGIACFDPAHRRLEFIHRSFAEYFVGRFFAEFWNNTEQYSQEFLQKVGLYFICNLLGLNDVTADTYGVHDQKGATLLMQYSCRKSFYNFELSMESIRVKYSEFSEILQFLNSKGHKLEFGRSAQLFRQALESPKSNTLEKLKAAFREVGLVLLCICIDSRFTVVFSLVIEIIKSLFEIRERHDLLAAHIIENKLDLKTSTAILLCRIAMSGSTESACELFQLFGESENNYLLKFCERYPQEYRSPLEVAIKKHDLDMAVYFADKVVLPASRLFLECVSRDGPINDLDAEISNGIKAVEAFFKSSDNILELLSVYSLHESFLKCYEFGEFHALKRLIINYNRSFKSIKVENKRFLLEATLGISNDEETVNLLLLLCGNTYKCTMYTSSDGHNTCTFTAEEVLDALDMIDVRNVFSKLELPRIAFIKCVSLETLKVLTSIQYNCSSFNKNKRNYLHYSVYNKNIDWVNYLIRSGHDVNQRDLLGNTPLLHCICPSVEITRSLVEAGADVLAVNEKGMNIAHLIFDNYYLSYQDESKTEFISYLMGEGINQLWEMRNSYGETPREEANRLVKGGFVNHYPLLADILRLLENQAK